MQRQQSMDKEKMEFLRFSCCNPENHSQTKSSINHCWDQRRVLTI